MVMTHEEATAMIAAAQEATANGGEVPAELRCQYPSKRCDHIRTTKRGGGLHRLCSFHRQRANKNQWLVDQRRRLRREREGCAMYRSYNSGSPVSVDAHMMAAPAMLSTMDVLDIDATCAPLCDEDLQILQALLFDEDDGHFSDFSEMSDVSDVFVNDVSMDWTM